MVLPIHVVLVPFLREGERERERERKRERERMQRQLLDKYQLLVVTTEVGSCFVDVAHHVSPQGPFFGEQRQKPQ